MAERRRIAATLIAVLLAAPLTADVLVLRDGGRVTTRGAWRERGALIVFTDEGGQLRSVRARDVDVENSRAATDEAAAASTRPAEAGETSSPESQTPVLRLTEADFPPVDDPDAVTPAERMQRPVVLYSTSWCGWCRKTRSLFAELGVEFVDHDVERDPRAEAERTRLAGGSRSVPVVDWRGETVRGYAESRFRALAARDRENAARATAVADDDRPATDDGPR